MNGSRVPLPVRAAPGMLVCWLDGATFEGFALVFIRQFRQFRQFHQFRSPAIRFAALPILIRSLASHFVCSSRPLPVRLEILRRD